MRLVLFSLLLTSIRCNPLDPTTTATAEIPPFVNRQLEKLSRNVHHVCGVAPAPEVPKHCACHDGTTNIEQPNLANLHELLKCNPKKCQCQNGEDKELTVVLDPILPGFLRKKFEALAAGVLTLCSGAKADLCHCSRGDPTSTIPTPFEDPHAVFRCLPKSCSCPDGTKVDILPAPSSPSDDYLDTVNTACDGAVPSHCKCSKSAYDSTKDDKAEMPFLFAEDLLDCAPEECSCQDGSTVVPPTRPDHTVPRPLDYIGDHSPKELANHILSSVCEVNSTVEECTCKDGSVFEQPFRPHKLFKCRPDTCKCLNQAGEEKHSLLAELQSGPLTQINKLHTICPGGLPAKSCSCTRGVPTVPTIQPPFGSSFDILLDCLPDKCECADATEVKVPPESLIHKIRTTCPNGPPLTCESSIPGNPVEKFPLNLRKILFESQPKSCICAEGEPAIPITAFGCATGGLPICPQETPYRCSKGSIISLQSILKAQQLDECVCEEGAGLPVCFGSNEPAACPDGSKPDEALLPSFLHKCAGRAQ